MEPSARMPADSTKTTRALYDILFCSTARIYQKIKDPKDKFIVCYCFEMGYSQYEAALALDLSESNISDRLKRLRLVLKDNLREPEENGQNPLV